MADIIIVGSCNMDFITYAPKFPEHGETIYGTKYVVGFGGKGANQCVASAKLGASTALVARVGTDHNGTLYLENMAKYDVNIAFVKQTIGADTGIAAITVAENGGNNIVIVPGANKLLSVEDVNNASDLIGKAKVLLCQMEVEISTTTHALKMAREFGVKTILNLAPAMKVGNEVLQYCDILCLNEAEASSLLLDKPIDNVQSALSSIKSIVEMGCKSCVITLGSEGCVYCEEHSEPYHIPLNISVNALDTTGAGDCFIGALAYFLAYHDKLPMKTILERANAVAANSVTKLGTQSSYPVKNDLNSKMFA